MKLHLDDDQLAACVGCGLCLPHCPTFRVTGEEGLSPRGRIAAMRLVHLEDREVDQQITHFVETCVQCRGCEPACPSGVRFGALMEGTRRSLAEQHRITPRWTRWGFAALARHRLLLAGSTALAAAQRVGAVPRRLGLGRLPVRRGALTPATGEDVWLFTGCVMDAWQRSTHRSTAAVLTAVGATYRYPGASASCCGALHVHAGLHDQTVELASRVMAAMPGEAPIVVNSAGCGAVMKEYGELLGTAEAAAFARRVVDVHEFVARRIDRLPPGRSLGRVIVQDPCHLRHVQRVHTAVRTVLAPVAELVELDDDGLCCGAGGAYSALQPELAGEIRQRKLAAIERAAGGRPAVVASANPGCAMHLAAAGVITRHPMDLLAEALS